MAGALPRDGRQRRDSGTRQEPSPGELAACRTRGGSLLMDATRHFAQQSTHIDDLDGVLLTHAHRDASGGLHAVDRWIDRRGYESLPILAAPDTLALLQHRYRRLVHCELVPGAGEPRTLAKWVVDAVIVPHAEPHVPTYAQRLRRRPRHDRLCGPMSHDRPRSYGTSRRARRSSSSMVRPGAAGSSATSASMPTYRSCALGQWIASC